MKSLLKVSIHFNQVFKNRGGRWITVWHGGKHVNGKVLSTNPIWATIQPAATPTKRVRVLNFRVWVVNADHVRMTREGNMDKRDQMLLF